jgi:hypothetical protein
MNEIPEPSKIFLAQHEERLKLLCDEADNTTVNNIREFQLEHRNYLSDHYHPFNRQFEMYFSMMVDISYNLNYLKKKDWPKNRALQYVIATHALKQFYSAYDLYQSGFYEDSLALIRSIYESFLRIVFISCNPATPSNAYYFKGQTGPRFNATGFVKDELGLKWENYSVLSVFAHSNTFRVIEEMVDNVMKGQNKPISLKYESDDDMISAVVNYLLFMIVAFMRLFNEVFMIDTKEYNGQLILLQNLAKLSQYSNEADLTLKNHSENKLWRQTGYDLDDIFRLMEKMDGDSTLEWKKVWKNIRSQNSYTRGGI